MMDAKSAIAVKLTDNATFPLAREVMKFETLPPGQAATKIIPREIEIGNFAMRTNKKVMAGMRTNWDMTPIITGLGSLTIFWKLSFLIPKATPNITNAMVMFMMSKPVESKFRV